MVSEIRAVSRGGATKVKEPMSLWMQLLTLLVPFFPFITFEGAKRTEPGLDPGDRQIR